MAAINQNQLALARASQPHSFLSQIPESEQFPLVKIPGHQGSYTRPQALLNFNMTNRNMNLPTNQRLEQLSSGGGGTSTFEIRSGSVGGNIDGVTLIAIVQNLDTTNAVSLIGNLAYWIDRIDIIDTGNGSAVIDKTSGSDLIHMLGMMTVEQQQNTLCKFNGQTGGVISEAISVAAGASVTLALPLYGEFFSEITPFMPAIKNSIEVRIVWRKWAEFAVPAAGVVDIQLTGIKLKLDYFEHPYHIRQQKIDVYNSGEAYFPLLTTVLQRDVRQAYSGATDIALTTMTGAAAFALVWMELQAPTSLTQRVNGVDLDDWLLEMVDSSGNILVPASTGKELRLLETIEKLSETPFFAQDRKVYPIWFCVDPIASARTGAQTGLVNFDGGMRLRLTPPSGTFNSGYILNFSLFYYKTVTFRDGVVFAQT